MALDYVTQHTAFIYDRGGLTRMGEIKDISALRWNRVRDDISEANITVDGASCSAQAEFLASIEPGRHELVIFRGDDRVWEGPITLIGYTRETMNLQAKDVMHYVYRTVMHRGYSSAYPNNEYAIARIKRIMIAELSRKEGLTPPVNVVPFITDHQEPDDAGTSAVTLPYQMTVFEHLSELAQRGGIDYTVVGRAIHLWDTNKALGKTPMVTENDFLGDVTVSVYGMQLVTFSASSDGMGTFGVAGGIDPYYGEWEVLSSAYGTVTGTDAMSTPSVAELTSQAQRNLSGGNPTPVHVRVPDNSSLNPCGILTVKDLVPGVHIPMLATLTARTVSQMQRLNKVEFTEDANGELISVVLFPAPKPDNGDFPTWMRDVEDRITAIERRGVPFSGYNMPVYTPYTGDYTNSYVNGYVNGYVPDYINDYLADYFSPDGGYYQPGGPGYGGGGALVYVQPNEPGGVPVGTLWYDTDATFGEAF